jgi:hydrogenase expression/formation protein HypE
MSEDRILLSHGDGGQLMADLIQRVFVSRLGTGEPAGDDSARVILGGHAVARPEGPPSRLRLGTSPTCPPYRSRLVFTTDAFVVDPIFFPGGDIGRLAVCGTVNDLAAAGARPVALSASFILEEGLLISDLERIVDSIAQVADEAGVKVICGDTKVVPRGSADGIYITTSGVGQVPEGASVSGANAQVGDAVLVSGPLGDHGLAVLSRREGLEFGSEIVSDCAPLAGMIQSLLVAVPQVHAMRDPTRGGLASALNEIARQSEVEIEVDEAAVPVRPAVATACEMLGLDPLYAANEGKMVVIVPADQAEAALAALRSHPLGREAAPIGRVQAGKPGRVLLKTALGSHRVLDRHVGEQMPRIC